MSIRPETAADQRRQLLVLVFGGIPLLALLTYLGMRGFSPSDLLVAVLISLAVARLFLFLGALRAGESALGRSTWLLVVLGLAAGVALDKLTGHSHVKAVALVGAVWGFALAAGYAVIRNRRRSGQA